MEQHKVISTLRLNPPQQGNTTLNDSLFDMFNCSPPELQEKHSPKRKQDSVLQAPQAPKTRNKLSLAKPSQRIKPNNDQLTSCNKENTSCNSQLSKEIFETDGDIFCTQMLKKIDQDSRAFEDKNNDGLMQGGLIFNSVYSL